MKTTSAGPLGPASRKGVVYGRFISPQVPVDVPRNGARYSYNETMERCVCSLTLVETSASSFDRSVTQEIFVNGMRVYIPLGIV